MLTIVTFVCISIITFSNIITIECGSTPPLAPALYVFGDSLVDNGNNNLLVTVAKANYPPYGHDFAYGPTGRFSNGKNTADFTADYLGLPYPPPYSYCQFEENRVTGYNFASGSCGILPETGLQYGLCWSLGTQIKLFEETVTTMLGSTSQNQVSQHLAKSIFLVVVGANDYLSNYFGSFFNSSQCYTPDQFAQRMVQTLSLQLQKLYEQGARKIIVSDIGPLGCLPSIVGGRSNPNERCYEYMNEVLSIYNDLLAFMLTNLTSTLEGSHFVLVKVYGLAYDAIFNPSSYGLSDTKNSCCVTLGGETCILGAQPCPNPEGHFFWDQVHPSQATYSALAFAFIHGSSIAFPVNLEQLVQL